MGMPRRAVRAAGAWLMVAGLAGAWGPKHRGRASWTALGLGASAGAAGATPGLVRAGVVDTVLDTVERPLSTGDAEVAWRGVLRVPARGRWALGLYTDRPGSVRLGGFAVVPHPGASAPLLVARS